MGEKVIPWGKSGPAADLPQPIKRPCDWGLESAAFNLEEQLGTVEAYNRLVAAALQLKARIDAGDIRQQNPLYATSVKGGVELPE